MKENKDKRDRKIVEMWMACYTQSEIADTVGCSQPTVNEVLSEKFFETESIKPAANHLADYDPPIYNTWKQPLAMPAGCCYFETGGGMLKRIADWLEKVSVAAFAIGIFHDQLVLGLIVAATALTISLMITKKIGG